MESTDVLQAVVMALLGSAPVLIVYVVALVVAMSKWNAHPRVSMFAASGAGLLLLITVIGRAAFTVLPIRMRSDGMSGAQLAPLLTGVSIVTGLLHAVGFALVLAAVYADRGESRIPSPSGGGSG